jgi:hypothetical protein
MTDTSGYSTRGSSAGPVSAAGGEKGYWDLAKLKRAYSDYLTTKSPEIEEAKEARRYYHGAQWTDEQIKILKKRKQPIATINRIGRKIDGVVGLLGKMRQDAKAFPRTPQHEQGADLATAAIRYALDEGDWQAKDSEAARDSAIEGIGGIEINLVPGDTQNPEDKDVDFDIVEPDSFFYDPRSYRADFTDARYMGVGKWMTSDQIKELIPGKDELVESSIDGDGSDLTSNPDRDNKWFSSDKKYIRVVDCWYRHKGQWCWAIFTGSTILLEGESYLKDEKEKTECKYVMFSCNVDHDGDRYGFIRNMKSQQDGINFKEAKLHHILGSRRLVLTQGAVDDVEKTRTEWARPDGVVVVNPGGEVKPDDQTFDFTGWSKLLQDAKEEIENFGPNPAVMGQGVEKQSGRAIALLQQAGVAELGPYINSYRGWKIRVYRTILNALQRHWVGERWIRVTDDQELAQFIQINGMGIDPNTGHPTIINAIGSLDVDVIIDEGPDSINMAADTYDALLALATSGAQVPPAVLIELSPGIDSKTKKRVLEMLQQASQPTQAQQIAEAGEAAKVKETESKVVLNLAKAGEAGQPEMGSPQQPQPEEVPTDVQIAEIMAKVVELQASAKQKSAAAYKTTVEAQLAPQKAAHEAELARANFQQNAKDKEEDRKVAAKKAEQKPARAEA